MEKNIKSFTQLKMECNMIFKILSEKKEEHIKFNTALLPKNDYWNAFKISKLKVIENDMYVYSCNDTWQTEDIVNILNNYCYDCNLKYPPLFIDMHNFDRLYLIADEIQDENIKKQIKIYLSLTHQTMQNGILTYNNYISYCSGIINHIFCCSGILHGKNGYSIYYKNYKRHIHSSSGEFDIIKENYVSIDRKIKISVQYLEHLLNLYSQNNELSSYMAQSFSFLIIILIDIIDKKFSECLSVKDVLSVLQILNKNLQSII